jgi:hypothetical protein
MNQKNMTRVGIFRVMREMLIEAPPSEIEMLAKENRTSMETWTEISKRAAGRAIARNEGESEKVIPMHKGLSTFLLPSKPAYGLQFGTCLQSSSWSLG